MTTFTRRKGGRLRHFVTIALLLAFASTAHGSENESQARRKIADAQKEYDLGEFGRALELYSEAYRLDPIPAFLFNIGQCHRQLGHWERAVFFYRRYLGLSPHASNTAQVEKLIGDCQTLLTQEQKRQEEEARVAREVSLAQARALTARQPNPPQESAAVTETPKAPPSPPKAPDGTTVALRAEAPPATSSAGEVSPPPAANVQAETSQPVRRLAWIPVAGGAVLGGVSAYFLISANAHYQALLNSDTSIVDPVRYASEGKTQQTTGLVLLGIGAAAIAGGAGMYLVGGGHPAGMSVLVAPSAQGLAVSGSFL
jgi:tetratricopeptide (TPR) repeat protein